MDDSGLARLLAARGCDLRRRCGIRIGRRRPVSCAVSPVSMLWLRGILCFSGIWRGLLVAAFLVGALPDGAGALEFFFHHVGRAARRTRLRHAFVPRAEFALGVAPASVKYLSAPAPALHDRT